jgi:glycine/D-amino acid oxidase-like deaminating enzyme
MHVVVIGAGIMGAATAYHLTLAGHQVSLLKRSDAPATGVTAKGFGWINLVHVAPEDEISFKLRVSAFDEYKKLRADLPEAFTEAREGALFWKSTAEGTTDLAERLLAAGVGLKIVDRAAFARLEPNLVECPSVAILAADDLALSPVFLTEKLLEAAVSRGARLFYNASVQSLRVTGEQVVGVEVDNGFIPADRVVLAAGPQTDELLEPFGVKLGLSTSPALLLRFKALTVKIAHILDGPRLEIRPTANGTLTAAEDWPGDGDVNKIARQVKSAIEDTFNAAGRVELLNIEVGQRPTFQDGLPRYGHLTGLKGCHVAVGHPGIILAPLLGRKIAEGIAT